MKGGAENLLLVIFGDATYLRYSIVLSIRCTKLVQPAAVFVGRPYHPLLAFYHLSLALYSLAFLLLKA